MLSENSVLQNSGPGCFLHNFIPINIAGPYAVCSPNPSTRAFAQYFISPPNSHCGNQAISIPFWKTSTGNYHSLKLGCLQLVGLLVCVMMDFAVLEPVVNLDVITDLWHTYYGRLHTYFSASFGLCFNVGWKVLIEELLFWRIPKKPLILHFDFTNFLAFLFRNRKKNASTEKYPQCTCCFIRNTQHKQQQ